MKRDWRRGIGLSDGSGAQGVQEEAVAPGRTVESVVNSESANDAVAHDHDTRVRLMTLLKGWMTMNDVKTVTKDPVCGMTVDPATSLHAERDERRSTSAASTASRSFCPHTPEPSRGTHPGAAVGLGAAVDDARKVWMSTRGLGTRYRTRDEARGTP